MIDLKLLIYIFYFVINFIRNLAWYLDNYHHKKNANLVIKLNKQWMLIRKQLEIKWLRAIVREKKVKHALV